MGKKFPAICDKVVDSILDYEGHYSASVPA
jgi:hypothetical protein